MRVRHLLLLLLALLLPRGAHARETPAEHAAAVYAGQQLASHPLHTNLPDYSLPPGKLAQAQHLASQGMTLHFAGVFWEIASLALLLWTGAVARLRDTAVRFRSRWIQGFLFTGLLLLSIDLLLLPLQLYGHRLALQYGFSVQGWASWFGDKAKVFGLTWAGGGLVVMLLFRTVRNFPRSWWVAFSVAWSLVLLLGFYASPAFTQIFYRYEPLQRSNPALVAQLERVVAKGHMNIPPERMFLMRASAKVTTLNADVEGFGSSKRVVVWDTTVAQATPDEITFIFGHESGHYALGHLTQGLLLGIAGSFAALYLSYVFVAWAIRRFGARWRVPGQDDWGMLPVLLLAVALLSAAAEPVSNLLIRANEHAADVYGQEAVHGIVADPQATGTAAFDLLGATSLDDPNPSRLYEFWTYSHPSIGRRAAFAHAYNPWVPGYAPKYFKEDGSPEE